MSHILQLWSAVNGGEQNLHSPVNGYVQRSLDQATRICGEMEDGELRLLSGAEKTTGP